MLTFAIGDIHGRNDLLQRMLNKISVFVGEQPHKIITLGDYVDRGPDSKGVLDTLRARPDIIALRGNHEDMMHRARGGEDNAVEHFLMNGGDATCRSFGVTEPQWIPMDYFDWIRNNTRLYYEDEYRMFVHAGVSFARDTAATQPENVCLWIREGFLEHNEPFFKYIVHGHTPQHKFKPIIEEPEILFNRTNLDTGAFYTGVLTCAAFNDTQALPFDIIQVSDKDAD